MMKRRKEMDWKQVVWINSSNSELDTSYTEENMSEKLALSLLLTLSELRRWTTSKFRNAVYVLTYLDSHGYF